MSNIISVQIIQAFSNGKQHRLSFTDDDHKQSKNFPTSLTTDEPIFNTTQVTLLIKKGSWSTMFSLYTKLTRLSDQLTWLLLALKFSPPKALRRYQTENNNKTYLLYLPAKNSSFQNHIFMCFEHF